MNPGCRFLVALAALLAASPVIAADSGWYAGVSFGEARLDRETDRLGSQDDALDFTSEGWSLQAGYSFSKYFAVEAAFTDYGEYRGHELVMFPGIGSADAGIFRAPGDFVTSARGFGITAVGTWPFTDRLRAHGYLGLQRREVETEMESGSVGGATFRTRDEDLAALFGLGLAFGFTGNFELRADWTTTEQLNSDTASDHRAKDQAETTMLSLGLRWYFR